MLLNTVLYILLYADEKVSEITHQYHLHLCVIVYFSHPFEIISEELPWQIIQTLTVTKQQRLKGLTQT